MAEISDLLGKTLTAVVVNDQNDQIDFTCDDGSQYRMHHCQDCCESVDIEDINGNLADLLGNPLLVAEESSNRDDTPRTDSDGDFHYTPDSFTWTFYRLATVKGFVVIRWFGSSNGYYSESVTVSVPGEYCYNG